MRILHLDAGKEMRGGQYQVLSLLEHAREHAEHHLLANSAELLQRASALGVAAQPLTMASAYALARRADVIHAHDARSHTLAAVLAPQRTVVSRRVAFPPKRTWWSRQKYRSVARYVAISHYVAQQLVEVGVEHQAIRVIPDGITLPDLTSDFSGGVVALHSHDPGKLMSLAQEVERRLRVRFTYSSDLHVDLRRAQLMLYLSTSEGLGSGALLANAYGVPVLASDVSGLREAISTGENGWLVDNDADSITEQLRLLLSDNNELRRMGLQARQRVQDRFDARKIALLTVDVYREMGRSA